MTDQKDTTVSTERLLPRPFCGSPADPEGWSSIDRKGPACTNSECDGAADSVEAWNRRSEPSEPVAVKALEWGKTSYGTPEAITIAGVYRINESMAGGWAVVAGSRVLQSEDGRVNFPTQAEAKAAAQTDFDQRIRSALQVAPVAVTDENMFHPNHGADHE